jgi:uncharacterized protein
MAWPPMSALVEKLQARGRIPVFPLPDTILFPHAVLPLHIFEPRYRIMTEEALRGDRFIAMALLKEGWEQGYQGNPAVHPIACAGLVEDEVRLPDGRFNIRLRGVTRVEILEFTQETPYRIAGVRVLEDRNGGEDTGADEDLRRLLASCTGLLQEVSGHPGQPVVLEGDVPLAVVVNTLCQSLSLETDAKQRLLSLDDVRERCRQLTTILEARWRALALRKDGEEGGSGAVH